MALNVISELPAAARIKKGSMHRIINHLIQLQELTVARLNRRRPCPARDLASWMPRFRLSTANCPLMWQTSSERLGRRGFSPWCPSQTEFAQPAACLCRSVWSTRFMPPTPSILARSARAFCIVRSSHEKYRQAEAPERAAKNRDRAVFSPELMISDLKSSERDDVLAELCAKMEAEGFVDNASKLLRKR